MKAFAIFTCILFIPSTYVTAQPSLRLDYFKKVPVDISNCGALYTYDSVALAKKKYILKRFPGPGLVNDQR